MQWPCLDGLQILIWDQRLEDWPEVSRISLALETISLNFDFPGDYFSLDLAIGFTCYAQDSLIAWVAILLDCLKEYCYYWAESLRNKGQAIGRSLWLPIFAMVFEVTKLFRSLRLMRMKDTRTW